MAETEDRGERRTSQDEVLGQILTAQLNMSKSVGLLEGHVDGLNETTRAIREDMKRLPCMAPGSNEQCQSNQDIGVIVRIVSKYWKKGTAAVAAIAAAAGFVWALIARLWS